MPRKASKLAPKKKTPQRRSKMSAHKKPSVKMEKTDGLMSEFLNQVTHAAYLVALKTGFRGSFIHFLSELQDALESVIRQDKSKVSVHR